MLDHSGTRRASTPLLRSLLGDVLRRTRLQQGRTLADVARDARVSMPYLSEVERGTKEASSEVLAAICDALGIELADLLAATGRHLADGGASRGQVVRFPASQADPANPAGQAGPAGQTSSVGRATHLGQARTPELGGMPEAVCLLAA